MWLEENLEENHPLMERVEFLTMQSCEKRNTEIHYKNVSRKFIVLDLRDGKLMAEVGKTVEPFGFEEHMHEKFCESSIFLMRVWAEKGLAKRGERHVKGLYKKYPEKFFDVTFHGSKNSSALEIVKCSYIIDEMTSQKRVSIKEESNNQGLLASVDQYADKIKNYEKQVKAQQHLISQVTSEEGTETSPVLGIESKEAAG